MPPPHASLADTPAARGSLTPLRNRAERQALLAGRVGLALTAVATSSLALWQIRNPTAGTVAIFAQYGVYLLFSVSFVLLAAGMFLEDVSRRVVTTAVVASLSTYLALAALRVTQYHNNPAFLAAMAIVAGLLTVAIGQLASRTPARGAAR